MVDRRQLRTCHRLMYRCPDEFEDGEEITFRSAGESIASLPDPVSRYDVVLVDPWHTFEASLRDLHLGFSLLRQGGTMVVHDCSPPSREMASPHFREGPWCGVTYRAYLEFLLASGLSYCTVDTDFGCGVVQKNGDGEAATGPATSRAKRWRDLLARDGDLYDVFSSHRRELLNLLSVEEFLLAHNVSAPFPVRWSNLMRRSRTLRSAVPVSTTEAGTSESISLTIGPDAASSGFAEELE